MAEAVVRQARPNAHTRLCNPVAHNWTSIPSYDQQQCRRSVQGAPKSEYGE